MNFNPQGRDPRDHCKWIKELQLHVKFMSKRTFLDERYICDGIQTDFVSE